ncbi:AsmA family protein [Ancylobacter vacuolatus]|uniref:AsmA protein n=1 Tax=Ancylobacter vacuolatus TaxID=223389 RepID=A0ABU0DG20_9HYPH|nr:AsmA family protein [Ancylobacter vacuolatus]MDQ0347278.1 AsmA protein [Ancylobacter vacuolatus]
MKKFIPFLLVPLALAMVAGVLAPKLASEETLREQARAMIAAATGAEPTLDGPVSFAVLPWPALTLGAVSLNDPRAKLDVPHMRVVLDLLPLLAGHVRADHIELTDARLTLADPGDGLAALSGFIGALGTAESRGDLVVTNGSVGIARGAAVDILIPQADLTIGWRGGGSVEVAGRAQWRGEPLEIDGRLTGLRALAVGEVGGLTLSLSAPLARASFTGGARLAGGPVVSGDLKVSAGQLREALAWLGMEAPTERGFGAFDLRGMALVSAQGAQLSQARLDLDGNSGVGAFNLRIDGARPMLQGSLASETIDLSPYGELSLSSPHQSGWSREAIDLGPTQAMDVELRLSAGRVRLGGADLQRMAASATAKGGRLSLTIGEAEAWGGLFRASLQLSPRPAGPGMNVRMDLSADDVALGAALGELFRFQRLEGTGSFRLSAVGGGTSIMDIAQGLGGAFTLTGSQGGLVGIDVGRILARLEKRPLSGGDLRGGRTPFAEIVVDARIAGGVVKLDRLDLSSDTLHVALAGESPVASRALDLSGLAQLVRAAPAGKAGATMSDARNGAGPDAVDSAGAAAADTVLPGMAASLTAADPAGLADGSSAANGTSAANGGSPQAAPAVAFSLPFIVRGDWQRPILLPDPQALIRRSGAGRALLGPTEKLDVSVPAP